MKKLLIATTLLTTLLFASCKKDVQGQCGEVQKHFIELNQYATGGFQYVLQVKFDNGRTKKVVVTEQTYFDFAAGGRICF